MVYTLEDIKHLETIADLQNKETEQSKPIFTQAENTSLTATLLKLCNKLRAEGYNKYAESIENKFVNYKAAGVHLYQAHKETGEDLVDQAHPDGDNKIVSDVSDNNGDVETIVSKHKKIVDVVNKQPTGKLASYVKQCKIALGQGMSQEDTDVLYNKAQGDLKEVMKLYSAMALKLGEDSDHNLNFFNMIQNTLNKKNVYNIQNIENFLNQALDGLKSDKEPGFFSNSEEHTTWKNEILPMFEIAYRYANDYKDVVNQIRSAETNAKTLNTRQQYDPNLANKKNENNQSSQLANSFSKAMKRVQLLINRTKATKPVNANEIIRWLNETNGKLDEVFKEFSANENKDDEKITKAYTNELNQLNSYLDAAQKKWNI
jgi:hypothetical protein